MSYDEPGRYEFPGMSNLLIVTPDIMPPAHAPDAIISMRIVCSVTTTIFISKRELLDIVVHIEARKFGEIPVGNRPGDKIAITGSDKSKKGVRICVTTNISSPDVNMGDNDTRRLAMLLKNLYDGG
jgi:hypothetical protein